MHSTDAADQILRGATEPSIREIRSQLELCLEREALETCKGLILGLQGVRDKEADSCLAWAPDFSENADEEIVREWIRDRKTGERRSFPQSFTDQYVPEWNALFKRLLKT